MSTQGQISDEEIETPEIDLPEGWHTTTLRELSTYVTSGSRNWSEFYADHGALFVRTQDINQNRLASDDSIARVDLPERVEGKRTLITKGDLLITITGANVGKCAYVDRVLPEAYVSQSVALIRLVEGLNGRFIQRQLISPDSGGEETLLQKSAYGVGRPVLNLDNVRDISILFPPSNEQQRIVEKIDDLLSHVDLMHARLCSAVKILNAFRKAVLATASSGKLTENWRKDSDGEEDLPDGWQWLQLGKIIPKGNIFDGPFGSSLKTSDYTSSGIRVVRLENIGRLRFISSKEAFISEEKYQSLSKHRVGEGDVIFASFIADEIRTCVLPNLQTEAIAKADCFCLRPIPERLNPHYLALQLASHESYDALVGEIHGATRPRVNTSQLKQLFVRVCPLDEQNEIVRRVDALLRFADAIEKRVTAATLRADGLTQAILRKAFRGELVPTEAELARREGREYEPASVLLDRIAKNRISAQLEPKRPSGRRTLTRAAR